MKRKLTKPETNAWVSAVLMVGNYLDASLRNDDRAKKRLSAKLSNELGIVIHASRDFVDHAKSQLEEAK